MADQITDSDSSSVSMGSISSGGGLVGGIIDSIVGPIMGVVNAKKAWKRQKKIMKRRIQWMVKDMQKAGINPMILAGGGISAPQGSAPQADTPGTDFGGAFSTYSAQQMQRAALEQDLRLKRETEETVRKQGNMYGAQQHYAEDQSAVAVREEQRKARFNDAGGPEAEAALLRAQAAAAGSGSALNEANKEGVMLDNVTRRNQAEAQKNLGPKWRTFKEVITPFTPFTK